jgi:hypothetical protein
LGQLLPAQKGVVALEKAQAEDNCRLKMNGCVNESLMKSGDFGITILNFRQADADAL